MLNEINQEIEKKVAEKIRRIRKTKGLTLAQLGKLIGLSPGLLSRIENNQSSPPIATLSKIAQGMGVPIAVFFEEDSSHSQRYVVTRHDRRKNVVRGGSRIGFTYQSINSMALPHLLEAFVVHYPPVKKEPDVMFDHPGEELLFVIKGDIELVYGNERITLTSGDAAHFDPSERHRAQCIGPKPAECLVVLVGERNAAATGKQ